MAQGVESELEIARLDLMQWIASDSLELPVEAKMDQDPLPFAGYIDPSSYPQLALQRQRSESAERSYRLSRSGYLPDLMIGYFNQSLERETGQQGIQLGISVPLFFGNNVQMPWWPKGARIAADRGGETARCIGGKAVVERTGMASGRTELV